MTLCLGNSTKTVHFSNGLYDGIYVLSARFGSHRSRDSKTCLLSLVMQDESTLTPPIHLVFSLV